MAVEYSHLFNEFNVILGCGLTSKDYQANSVVMVKNEKLIYLFASYYGGFTSDNLWLLQISFWSGTDESQ